MATMPHPNGDPRFNVSSFRAPSRTSAYCDSLVTPFRHQYPQLTCVQEVFYLQLHSDEVKVTPAPSEGFCQPQFSNVMS